MIHHGSWILTTFGNGTAPRIYNGKKYDPKGCTGGLRPCFKLREDVVISGGDGTTPNTAYVLK